MIEVMDIAHIGQQRIQYQTQQQQRDASAAKCSNGSFRQRNHGAIIIRGRTLAQPAASQPMSEPVNFTHEGQHGFEYGIHCLQRQHTGAQEGQ